MYTDNFPLSVKEEYLKYVVDGYSISEIAELMNISERDSRVLGLILKTRYRKNYIDFPNETWRRLDVTGYPLYYVSNYGRVRRMDRIKKPKLNSLGYLEVNLYHLTKQCTRTVHRLVMIGFTGVDSDLTVNHIDFNRTNNMLENLEWATYKEQVEHVMNDPIKRKNRIDSVTGSKNPQSKLTEEMVLEIRSLKNRKLTNRELSKIYGVNPNCIWEVRTRRSWKHI